MNGIAGILLLNQVLHDKRERERRQQQDYYNPEDNDEITESEDNSVHDSIYFEDIDSVYDGYTKCVSMDPKGTRVVTLKSKKSQF